MMDVYSSAQFYCVFREVVGVNAACNSPFIRNNTLCNIYINVDGSGEEKKEKKKEKKR